MVTQTVRITPTSAPDFNPRFINRRTPNMQYAADVGLSGPCMVFCGTPIVATTTAILNAPGALTSGATATFLPSQFNGTALSAVTGSADTIDARFGRNITVTGTSTRVLTVTGRDYLGQPMKETITMSAGTISGVKAFKWIDSLSFSAVADTVNPNVGVGDVLGLPYRCMAVVREFSDGVVASAGTFVAPLAVSTTPTATNADVRGTYDPNTTLDGAKNIELEILPDRTNLHGEAHFFS